MPISTCVTDIRLLCLIVQHIHTGMYVGHFYVLMYVCETINRITQANNSITNG